MGFVAPKMVQVEGRMSTVISHHSLCPSWVTCPIIKIGLLFMGTYCMPDVL